MNRFVGLVLVISSSFLVPATAPGRQRPNNEPAPPPSREQVLDEIFRTRRCALSSAMKSNIPLGSPVPRTRRRRVSVSVYPTRALSANIVETLQPGRRWEEGATHWRLRLEEGAAGRRVESPAGPVAVGQAQQLLALSVASASIS